MLHGPYLVYGFIAVISKPSVVGMYDILFTSQQFKYGDGVNL